MRRSRVFRYSVSAIGCRSQRSLKWTRTECIGDSEFIKGVCAQIAMGLQLFGDLRRKDRIKPTSHVNCREFLVFSLALWDRPDAPMVPILIEARGTAQ
jgi:hypothetical protein